MPSTTRRPSAAKDRRSSVEIIVLTATERLLADGASFTELGVRRIAEAAGIARSTFYLHFPDKTQLLLRMAETLGEEAFTRTTNTAIDLASITDALAATLAYYRERAHILAAVTEVAGYDPQVRAAWDRIIERFVRRGADLLRAEQLAGRTPPDLDPDTAAEVIIWGGIRVIVQQVTTRSPERDAVVARELAANQWHGGFRRPQSDSPPNAGDLVSGTGPDDEKHTTKRPRQQTTRNPPRI